MDSHILQMDRKIVLLFAKRESMIHTADHIFRGRNCVGTRGLNCFDPERPTARLMDRLLPTGMRSCSRSLTTFPDKYKEQSE